jgi:hypothetical protein
MRFNIRYYRKKISKIWQEWVLKIKVMYHNCKTQTIKRCK